MPEVLSSRANPRVRAWKALQSDARERRRRGRMLLEGVHLAVTYMERVGNPRELILTSAALESAEVAALSRRAGLHPVMVTRAVFAAFANTENPVGIALEVDLPAWNADLSGSGHCALIEGVQDAGNLGAIVRSAAAFGVDSIVVGPGCADPWSPKVLRAAMGGHFFLRIGEAMDLAPQLSAFTGLKVSTAPQGGESLARLDLSGPVAWILGSEARGISAALQESADVRARIAMPGGTESLNVAAAAAICFYERSRQLARVQAQLNTPAARS